MGEAASSAVWLRSACPLDCPDACTLEVAVEDGRVRAVRGSQRGNPLTGGWVCGKVRDLPRWLSSGTRLERPLRRKGVKGHGSFESCSWEEALVGIASRLLEIRDRFGGEAILPVSYGGSNGFVTQDTADALLFRRLGATRLLRTVCAAPSGRAQQGLFGGKFPGVAFEDYREAKGILLWGVNPAVTGVHLVPILEEARSRGAWIAVLDPRRTGTAARADLHLPVRPGTDLPVALALIRECFARGRADLEFLERHTRGWRELERRASPWTLERAASVAEVSRRDLEELLERYLAANPAVIRCGWGVERNRNGGSAVAAILALPAVAGKFGVRGGGFTLSNSGAWSFQGTPTWGTEGNVRSVNMNQLGRALLELRDPPIACLFVYNCNPWATLPEQNRIEEGLLREDLLTVVFDQVLTDTARFADWVLPATHFLEHHELSRGYGAYVLQLSGPVANPPGEARSNYSVFLELARRCRLVGEEERVPLEQEVWRHVIQGEPSSRKWCERLETDGWTAPDIGGRPVQFQDVFPATPDRKLDLLPETLDRECRGRLFHYSAPEASFPLALITPASSRRISSTFGDRDLSIARLAIHPLDASARGIATGEAVRVWNDLGEVECLAEVSHRVRPGVVELPKGLWSHNTRNGRTANALVRGTLTDLGGGATFNDARVEVERIS